MSKTRRAPIDAEILAAIPVDLRGIAGLILPIIREMVATHGWDHVRKFLFAYKGSTHSWDRRLLRQMTVAERIRWRKIFSRQRVAELQNINNKYLTLSYLRRVLIQKVITIAIEALLGAL